MRAAGYTYAEIARECEYSCKNTAYHAVSAHLGRELLSVDRIDDHYRQQHLVDLQTLKSKFAESLERMVDTKDFPRYMDTYLRIIEREAKLTGADKPFQVSLSAKPTKELSYNELQAQYLELKKKDADENL